MISGKEEGGLAYIAAKAGLGLRTGSLVVFDTGGGGSRFTFGHDAIVDERFSVDVGAVSYTERYRLDRAVSPDVLREAKAAMSVDLARHRRGVRRPRALVAMGGAVTDLTAVRRAACQVRSQRWSRDGLDGEEVDGRMEWAPAPRPWRGAP